MVRRWTVRIRLRRVRVFTVQALIPYYNFWKWILQFLKMVVYIFLYSTKNAITHIYHTRLELNYEGNKSNPNWLKPNKPNPNTINIITINTPPQTQEAILRLPSRL